MSNSHNMTTSNQWDAGGCMVLVGYYDCGRHPDIAFTFDGDSGPELRLEPLRTTRNSEGKCISSLVGGDVDALPTTWYLGQAWLQGKYVDFDAAGGTVSAAYLKQ